MEWNTDFSLRLLDGRIDRPQTTGNQLLASVLTLFVKGVDEKLMGGTALLIGPDTAITVSHCVAQWSPNLNVKSAINGKASKVESIAWSDGTVFELGKPVGEYPAFVRGKCTETFVVLKLKKNLPGPYAKLEIPRVSDKAIAIAARSKVAKDSVDYARLDIVANVCTLVAAIEDQSLSYPRVSGGPAFIDDILRSADGERPVAIGLQVCACNDVPADFPVPGTRRFAGILPVTQDIKAYADSLDSAAASSREGGAHAKSAAMVSKAPREFVLASKADGALHVEKCLLEINDLDYFHIKPYRLEVESATLNLLTNGGAVWITRVTGKDQLRMQIVRNVGGSEQGSTVDLVLDLVKCDNNIGAWLEGQVDFKSLRIFVYLFRLKDKVVLFKPRKGRIYIEAYTYQGAHYDHRPQVSLLTAKLGQCGSIRSSARSKLFTRLSDDPDLDALDDRLDRDDLVQDDAGNGHEGHDPP